MKTTLSIVVPSFGEPQYLYETLESLIKTQDESVEVIVIDDASPTDFIKKICEKFDKRIIYFRNSSNLGISKNFNNAISLASGKFVQLVGPDDRLSSSMVDVIESAKEHYDYCFGIHPKTISINKTGNQAQALPDLLKKFIKPKSNKMYSQKTLRRLLLVGNWTYHPAIIWNKANLQDLSYDSSLKYCMDLDLLLRLSKTEYGLYVSDKGNFEYRRHWGSVSMSATPILRLKEELNVLKKNADGSALELGLSKVAIFPRLNYLVNYLVNYFTHLLNKFLV